MRGNLKQISYKIYCGVTRISNISTQYTEKRRVKGLD